MPVDTPRNIRLSFASGLVRDTLAAEFDLGESHFTQKIRLAAGSVRLDFATHAVWRETHKLCRVAFPLDILADEASCEIQYGVVKRPTNDNTKWQHAQFECLGQRFADLSEHDFGAALLNNCKYGYRVKGHELSLSLLRAPAHPDPDADRGVNRFTYAFLPHTGDLASSDVLAHATALNQGVERFEGLAAGGALGDHALPDNGGASRPGEPVGADLRAARCEAVPAPLPLVVSGPVEFAVLKRAEKEDALVVRLVEQRGVRCEARVTVAPGAGRLVETNLMEWDDLGEIDTSKPLEFAPFAMRTFKLVR
jgi:alpha-mannosidase